MAISPIFESASPTEVTTGVSPSLALGGFELNATAYDVDTNTMAIGGMGLPTLSLLSDATPTAPA